MSIANSLDDSKSHAGSPNGRSHATEKAPGAGTSVKSRQKYVVTKTDGSPPDPNARYLVLRLDTDLAARKAGRVYAEEVAATDPALAAAILASCRARVKRGWDLPPSPRCQCGSECRPVAIRGLERWRLEWECLECCDPADGPEIPWPFVEAFAEEEDFQRLGIDWDNA